MQSPATAKLAPGLAQLLLGCCMGAQQAGDGMSCHAGPCLAAHAAVQLLLLCRLWLACCGHAGPCLANVAVLLLVSPAGSGWPAALMLVQAVPVHAADAVACEPCRLMLVCCCHAGPGFALNAMSPQLF